MSHIEPEHSPPASFRILDLFAGPGGLDVAAHVLGYEVTGIEWDAGACATRTAAGMDTFQGDVRHYRAAFFPLAEVLTGGPPCQTFTVAGHGAGRRALDQVVEYIEQLHNVVRSETPDWMKIFRTWRRISEELRRKEIEAKEVRADKCKIEEARASNRKAIKSRLKELGQSPNQIKTFLKELKTPQYPEIPNNDDELKGILKEFWDLTDGLEILKSKLEELGDERTGLVLQPLWWIIERSKRPGLKPYEAVILEQVPAVMPVWKEYAKVLASLGYRTRRQLMHTEEFGVPQTRRRAVLMARLAPTARSNEMPTGTLLEVPETHKRYRPGFHPSVRPKALHPDTLFGETSDSAPKAPPREQWMSMELALNKARRISSGKVHKRPAFTVISNYGTGGDPEARGRRDHNVPSATITGKVSRNRLVHQGTDNDLEEFDRFTHAEAGVLQTFPVKYPWSGNDVPQQIGNAVPPLLALHVLQHVLEPGVSDSKAKSRLKQVAERLESWKPAAPVRPRMHAGLKGHPLTDR
ncbi:DNA cytosine methyltransferase [Streptomyces sp. NPDC048278]|uniref:DNA cytosine methyltransferase n=1 Tax=Streptomyces sp. NPDC048278 TaxID=3155809 RepID=UPI0034205CDF